MKKMFLLLLSILVITGCVNFRNDQYFDSRQNVEFEKKKFPLPPTGLASVYLIADKVAGQSIVPFPVPPINLAVNDRIVTMAPHGSFVHLLFQPGKHKLAVATQKFEIINVTTAEIKANSTYYFSLNRLFHSSGKYISTIELKEISLEEGQKLVNDYKLAKTVHIPISLVPFEQSQRRKEEEQRKQEIESAKTAEGLSDFFAAAAAVALIALLVLGSGLTIPAGSTGQVPPTSPSIYSNPPAYVSGATSVRSGTGRAMSIETTKNSEATTIKNLSTGTSYRLEGNRYLGSDKSWFQVSGNTIFSSTGNYYTRAGNTLTSNDGRK